MSEWLDRISTRTYTMTEWHAARLTRDGSGNVRAEYKRYLREEQWTPAGHIETPLENVILWAHEFRRDIGDPRSFQVED